MIFTIFKNVRTFLLMLLFLLMASTLSGRSQPQGSAYYSYNGMVQNLVQSCVASISGVTSISQNSAEFHKRVDTGYADAQRLDDATLLVDLNPHGQGMVSDQPFYAFKPVYKGCSGNLMTQQIKCTIATLSDPIALPDQSVLSDCLVGKQVNFMPESCGPTYDATDYYLSLSNENDYNFPSRGNRFLIYSPSPFTSNVPLTEVGYFYVVDFVPSGTTLTLHSKRPTMSVWDIYISAGGPKASTLAEGITHCASLDWPFTYIPMPQ